MIKGKLLKAALESINTESLGRVISMEEEIEAINDMAQADAELSYLAADTERTEEIKDSLSDLAFVADNTEKELSPRETAFVQIATDMAMAGTGMGGDELVPSLEDGELKSDKIKQVIEKITKIIKESSIKFYELLKKIVAAFKKVLPNINSRLSALLERASKIDQVKKYDVKGNLGFMRNPNNMFADIQQAINSVPNVLTQYSMIADKYSVLLHASFMKETEEEAVNAFKNAISTVNNLAQAKAKQVQTFKNIGIVVEADESLVTDIDSVKSAISAVKIGISNIDVEDMGDGKTYTMSGKSIYQSITLLQKLVIKINDVEKLAVDMEDVVKKASDSILAGVENCSKKNPELAVKFGNISTTAINSINASVTGSLANYIKLVYNDITAIAAALSMTIIDAEKEVKEAQA